MYHDIFSFCVLNHLATYSYNFLNLFLIHLIIAAHEYKKTIHRAEYFLTLGNLALIIPAF